MDAPRPGPAPHPPSPALGCRASQTPELPSLLGPAGADVWRGVQDPGAAAPRFGALARRVPAAVARAHRVDNAENARPPDPGPQALALGHVGPLPGLFAGLSLNISEPVPGVRLMFLFHAIRKQGQTSLIRRPPGIYEGGKFVTLFISCPSHIAWL